MDGYALHEVWRRLTADQQYTMWFELPSTAQKAIEGQVLGITALMEKRRIKVTQVQVPTHAKFPHLTRLGHRELAAV